MAKVTVTLGARGKMCVVIGVGLGAPSHGQGFDSWRDALAWCHDQGFEVSNRAAAEEIALTEIDAELAAEFGETKCAGLTPDSPLPADAPPEARVMRWLSDHAEFGEDPMAVLLRVSTPPTTAHVEMAQNSPASKPTTFAEALEASAAMAQAREEAPFDMLSLLARLAHGDAKAKGWWDGVSLPLTVSNERERLLAEEKLFLIVTEVAEAMEEIRDGHEFTSVYYEVHGVPTTKPLGFPIELADSVIRAFDIACACGVDLGAAVKRKMEFNRTRAHRHGGKLS
jgi:hypothetical protein